MEDDTEFQCDGRGTIDKYMYRAYATIRNLTFNSDTGKVLNPEGYPYLVFMKTKDVNPRITIQTLTHGIPQITAYYPL
jgi:hypothetical protein